MKKTFTLIVSGTALIAATYGLARFGYGLFVPMFMVEFGLTSASTGAISSGGFVAYCVAATIAFRLAASPRLNVLLAGVAACVGSVGVAVSASPWMLAGSVLVAGAGAGFASPGTVALVERAASGTADRMQAIVNSGTGFGVILAGPLALMFSDNWRSAWWLIALLCAGSTLATLLNAHSAPRASSTIIRSFHTNSTSARRPAVSLPETPQSPAAITLKPLRWAAACALLGGASSAAVWTFGRATVTTAGQLTEADVTVFWILLGAAGVGGALSGDLVTRRGVRTGWLAASLAMALATGLVGAFPAVAPAVYIAGAVFGASYVGLTGVLIAWASRILPGRAAAGTAALFIALAAGQAGGAVLIGLLLDIMPSIAAFCCAALLAGCSLVPALYGTSTTAATAADRRLPSVLP